jgi:magnesium transporter
MDTGGNCGSQTSTLVIRGFSQDEIRLKDFFRVWWKEIRVAFLVGTALALINTIRIIIQYGTSQILLALVVGLTLLLVTILAKSLGCILPMLAKILKLDPAIMASPLITTIVDTCSVFVYFKLAVLIFGL